MVVVSNGCYGMDILAIVGVEIRIEYKMVATETGMATVAEKKCVQKV